MIVWLDPKTKEKHWIIPKNELIVGGYYYGKCRNARIARWDGKIFTHWRTKFGDRFLETIHHPEDDDGFDLFLAEEYIGKDIAEMVIPLEDL